MKVVHSDEVVKEPVRVEGAEGVDVRWLIGRKDGAENFAMRLFEVEPGGYTPLHTHAHEHEVYVLEGEGAVVCDDGERAFGRDFVIFVPGGVRHRFKNTGTCVLKFLCIVPLRDV